MILGTIKYFIKLNLDFGIFRRPLFVSKKIGWTNNWTTRKIYPSKITGNSPEI